jgi:hypothetical protein
MSAPILPSGRRPSKPAGLHYDGKTRDFTVNSSGQLNGVHPVDEGMAMSIMVPRGSIKAAPNTGNDLHKIEYLGTPNLDEQVRACVYNAQPLKRFLEEDKIEIRTIVSTVKDSRLSVSISYVNKLDSDARSATSHDKTLEWYG